MLQHLVLVGRIGLRVGRVRLVDGAVTARAPDADRVVGVAARAAAALRLLPEVLDRLGSTSGLPSSRPSDPRPGCPGRLRTRIYRTGAPESWSADCVVLFLLSADGGVELASDSRLLDFVVRAAAAGPDGRGIVLGALLVRGQSASAPWRLPLDCLATWIASGLHPQLPADWSCSDVCVAPIMFVGSAFEFTVFDWSTVPSSGAQGADRDVRVARVTCEAEDAAPASCSFSADWSVLCTSGPIHPRVGGLAARGRRGRRGAAAGPVGGRRRGRRQRRGAAAGAPG